MDYPFGSNTSYGKVTEQHNRQKNSEMIDNTGQQMGNDFQNLGRCSDAGSGIAANQPTDTNISKKSDQVNSNVRMRPDIPFSRNKDESGLLGSASDEFPQSLRERDESATILNSNFNPGDINVNSFFNVPEMDGSHGVTNFTRSSSTQGRSDHMQQIGLPGLNSKQTEYDINSSINNPAMFSSKGGGMIPKYHRDMGRMDDFGFQRPQDGSFYTNSPRQEAHSTVPDMSNDMIHNFPHNMHLNLNSNISRDTPTNTPQDILSKIPQGIIQNIPGGIPHAMNHMMSQNPSPNLSGVISGSDSPYSQQNMQSLNAITEKLQILGVQMSQLKGQINAIGNSPNPQSKDLIPQMVSRLQQFQQLFMQLYSAQQQLVSQSKGRIQPPMNQQSVYGMPGFSQSYPSMPGIPPSQTVINSQQMQNYGMPQMPKQLYGMPNNTINSSNINNNKIPVNSRMIPNNLPQSCDTMTSSKMSQLPPVQQRMLTMQMMNNQRYGHGTGHPGMTGPYVGMPNVAPVLPNMNMNIHSVMNPTNMRGMQNIQRDFSNYNNFPVSLRQPDPYSNIPGSSRRSNLLGSNRKKRRRSESESEDISSSPEPTKKEIDDMANISGPVRRSTRNRKHKSYTVDIDNEEEENGVEDTKSSEKQEKFESNKNNDGTQDLVPVQHSKVIEGTVFTIDKILSDDIRKNEDGTEVEEFYVKYKFYSYLHCEWLTADEMKAKDKLAFNKIKRYKLKREENLWQFTLDDEPFNPDYIEVDRILAKTITEHVVPAAVNDNVIIPKDEKKENPLEETVRGNKDGLPTCEVISNGFTEKNSIEKIENKERFVKVEGINPVKLENYQTASFEDGRCDKFQKKEAIHNDVVVKTAHYLIKWCSLAYEDSTWEPEDLIEDEFIEEFEKRQRPPPPQNRVFVSRPNMNTWKELAESPLYKNENTLRPYQLEGLNWLRFCYYRWQNCILADEMGLGKTIQSIAFIHSVSQLGIKGPFLVIAPLSTILNWYREFRSWTDLNVIVYHGSSYSRNLIHKYEVYYENESQTNQNNTFKFEVLITTYEMILSELKFLSSIRWRLAVVDEAHRLKNKKCKLLECMRYLNIEHRVLLTGTPLQNSLEELYSLLSFLDPNNIPSEEAFMGEFGNLQTNDQVSKLQRVLKPIMLRRLKEDVEKNLAPKEETIIEIEMTTIQKKIYRSILEKNFSFLAKGTSTTNVPNLMNTMMELRKCCNHPFLIKGCEDRITSEYYTGNSVDNTEHHLRCLIESSGKLVLVDKLLPKLKDNGHRVLLFSQMVKVLDIIENYLRLKKYTYERIDGSIRGNLRQAAIDRYSRPDSDRFVFLLCTKAGGLGINLTAADTVIIFDSDWNPQNDIQAQARCHRIGQNKAVKVYRLICRNTYEREMFDRASMKLGLDRAVLQSSTHHSVDTSGLATKNERQQLSKQDVEDLLRKGAYGALMEEDTLESQQFCAEDIDQILERRAKVVQIAGEGQGSTFAKASFSAEKKNEIDLDDPDFWEKWAKKAKINVNTKNDLIHDTPRERKLVNYDDPDVCYSGEDSEVEMDGSTTITRSKTAPRFSWLRIECFKVERQLLIYGWGRWDEIIVNGSFKSVVYANDAEEISKCIIVYCWHYSKVEASTKAYIENMIKSSFSKSNSGKSDDASDYNYRPYGKRTSTRSKNLKKSRRQKEQHSPCASIVNSDWKSTNPDLIILEPSYRKHLQHNANRILLRVRLLHVLQNEIINRCEGEIRSNCPESEIELALTPQFSSSGVPPVSWWNEDCDKSLLIGTFKHGYEKYKEMCKDTSLIFHKVVPADSLRNFIENNDIPPLKDVIKQSSRPRRRGRKRKVDIIRIELKDSANVDNSDFNSSDDDFHQHNDSIGINDAEETIADQEVHVPVSESNAPESTEENRSSAWPSNTELNQRFRRLVSSVWKTVTTDSNEKGKRTTSRGKIPRMFDTTMWNIRLSRRDESNFFKYLMAYGLVVSEDCTEGTDITEVEFIWDQFRTNRSLEKRDDSQLTHFARHIIFCCEKIVQNDNDVSPNFDTFYSIDFTRAPSDFKQTENYSLEKALKVLNRVAFFFNLRKVAKRIEAESNDFSNFPLIHPSEFPPWWQPLKHDIMLIKFIDKYGLNTFDKEMFFDNEFDFVNVLEKNYDTQKNKEGSVQFEENTNITDLSFDLIASLLNWPKIRALYTRARQICYFVNNITWPVDAVMKERYSNQPKSTQQTPAVTTTTTQAASTATETQVSNEEFTVVTEGSNTLNENEPKENLPPIT